MRPMLHYTPRRGWMNDPNGLIHHGGVHHLFYQTNPTSTDFGQIHWGHATSHDLLTWTEQPIALSPDQNYDSHGCWSGVAIDDDGHIAILYSGHSGGDYQLPCLAWATDDTLDQWKKDPANPVVSAPPALPEQVTNFRDHSITRRPDGSWRQLVGGSTRSGGAIFAYTATDLRHWAYTGLFADYTTLPINAEIWECPDSFTIEGRTVLIISGLDDSGANKQIKEVTWALGSDDGYAFTADHTGVLDYGDRFYAPQSYWTDDGRRLMFGWIRTQADTIPDGQGWVGAMSLPRELTIRDGTLAVTPARELHHVRGESHPVDCPAGSTSVESTPPDRSSFEIEIEANLATAGLTLGFRDPSGRQHDLPLASLLQDTVSRGLLTVYFDSGIVEAFHDGRAAAWTTGAVTEISNLRIDYDATNGPRQITLRAISRHD